MVNGNKHNIVFINILLLFFLHAEILFAQEEPADIQMKNAVENELMLNTSIHSNSIDVEIQDGIVTLSGSVNNLLSKDRALKITGTIKGVRAVINEIEGGATFVSDSLLEHEVTDALVKDPACDSYQLNVSADTEREKLYAEINAIEGGAKEVENNVNVDYTP